MMKKITLFVTLLGAVLLAGQSYAGSACCSLKKPSANIDKSACASALSGIELTDDQKAEVAKIEADCKEAGMTKEACSASMSKIRNLLNEDQQAKFDAALDKAGCK